MALNTFINNQRLAQLAGVNFDSEIIHPGPLVYSRTHLIQAQFPKLSEFGECVLITSFSDANCSSTMAAKLPPNVRKWFSNNVTTHDPRVEAVPLGLRTSPEGERVLRTAMDKGRLPERNLVYLNCYRRLRKTPNPRRGIYEMFASRKWVTAEGGFEHVPMEKFYEGISSHAFTLSPPGAGLDCHRHWEAILLGSIPIVLKSKATDILKDLPCLRVKHWGEVHEKKLRKVYPELIKRFDSPAMDKIWFEYWQERILSS